MRAEVWANTTVKALLGGFAHKMGIGSSVSWLLGLLTSSSAEQDEVHEWKVVITPKAHSFLPAFEVLKNGQPFSLVPLVLVKLQQIAENICDKILGYCQLSNFTGKRLASAGPTMYSSLIEAGSSSSMGGFNASVPNGRYQLGMTVLTKVQGDDFTVRLTMTYDTTTKDFTFQGVSNDTLKNFIGIDGLSVSPRTLRYSTYQGILFDGQVSFKTLFDVGLAIQLTPGARHITVTISDYTSPANVMGAIGSVLGFGDALNVLLDSEKATFDLVISKQLRAPKGPDKVTTGQPPYEQINP